MSDMGKSKAGRSNAARSVSPSAQQIAQRRQKRWAVLMRSLAAMFGGYAVTTLAVVCLSAALPMAPAFAVITATLLSFLILAVIAMWCFAAKTAARAWLGLLLMSLPLAALYGVMR
ncbi:conserved hypothetical protein [gamma proteobacterium HTCC5015]|nr:conserved hypothetical protein [gamma proteobacterium HTCC5015]